jgi:hypothetical protein
MEDMEPVVRVGFVPGLVVGALAEGVGSGFVVPERLCLPAKGAFLTPSETEARGRVAVAEDLTDVVEPAGETTGRAVVVGLEVVDTIGLDELEDDKGGFEVEEDKGGFEVEEDKDGFEGGPVDLEGAMEARRAGPVTEVPVDGAFAIEAGLAALEAGTSALTDFLRDAAAEEALLATDSAALATVLVTGAVFTEPAPNVPELRIYGQTVKEMAQIGPTDAPS